MAYDQIIGRLYAAFNARDFDEVFVLLSPRIVWANAWEGGFVNGHEGIRDYWTRQWQAINPHVEPVEVIQTGDDTVSVKVNQVVKDMNGLLVAESLVNHLFTFSDGLISRFDIGTDH